MLVDRISLLCAEVYLEREMGALRFVRMASEFPLLWVFYLRLNDEFDRHAGKLTYIDVSIN